jgi:cytohesin/brefeldin A-inhibited guanine nucleotide-exchange protein
MEMIDENYNQIELILKDCKKIIKRLKNHLNDMPNTIDFKNEVFKIVRSFCIYRPDLIYNKNISELAIFFYINCNMNEYDTFVFLCNFIINNYFFKYIQNDTLFMKNHLKFFEKLIEKYLPSIHNHFKVLDFNINIFFYKWVEFLFLKTFNYNICLRIFDNFIIKGEIFIFEISLATLFILKNSIINNDQIGLVDLLKKEIIVINEDALFEYVKTLNIKKEYNDYFNLYILGKEKIELLQDL